MENETYRAGDITLQKVREYVWELPREGDMRVPGRVLASEALLDEISQDKTLEQVKNSAHLPGIAKYALCMPDAHQGYGFPVGGVGAMDTETGCISPGAVGYDINCLAGESKIRLEFGRYRQLSRLEDDFEHERAVVAADSLTPSSIRLFTESERRDVYALSTESGARIEATADHPFLTPDGMVELRDLEPGDSIFVHPFEGIEDETPESFVVVDRSDLEDEDPAVIEALERRGLLPLRSTDDAFHRLLTLLGYHIGAGAIEGEGRIRFDGDAESLDEVRAALQRVGFVATDVERDGYRTAPGDGDRDSMARSIRVTSRALERLLRRLARPLTSVDGTEPARTGYLRRLVGWQRALFVSAYCGAAMDPPVDRGDGSLAVPTVSAPRREDIQISSVEFLETIADLLTDLGVRSTVVRGDSVESDFAPGAGPEPPHLRIEGDPSNLVGFFSRIGYRYNPGHQRRGVAAVQYLNHRGRAADRGGSSEPASAVAADGGSTRSDSDTAMPNGARGIRRERAGDTRNCRRKSTEYVDFEDFMESVSVTEAMTVEAEIASIEGIGPRTVYDLGVDHAAHNFVANGFVVSNCGVRMVRTSLTYDELEGREEELVDALFANVPTGLGGGGVVEGDLDTVDAILDRGMQWALEEGYAARDDLRHCEDEGFRPEGDPSVISQRAKDRGKNQIGSLGSGNHFLEVQRVTDVFRDDVAHEFGLETDQLVVLIHCGSRGLGHQVCTDYLRRIEKEHADLLERLPDKELAAAPAGSDLADEYYRAMCAAINFAWVNRQLVMYQTRRVFEKVFDDDWEALGMDLLYDVAHNIAKKEIHDVDGVDRELFVHRKGATRAFPAGRSEVPAAYRDVGQPIIIPGSMGSGSYVLRGGEPSMELTFGSTAHGAGRVMSRTQAKKQYWGGDVQTDLRETQKVFVKAASGATIAEEAPGVYKDVDEVVRVSDALGIGDRVVRTFPVVNIKG